MILFIGLLFLVLFTVFSGTMVNTVLMFIDAPSLILILVPLMFFLLVTKDGSVLTGYIKSSFKKNYEYGKYELESIAKASKNAIKITLAAGAFSFLVGLIAVFGNLDDPRRIGPALAVSLISSLYSIGISFFVFCPVQVWAENKIR